VAVVQLAQVSARQVSDSLFSPLSRS